VQNTWNTEVKATNSVTRVTAKFKLLRRVLKNGARGYQKSTISFNRATRFFLSWTNLKNKDSFLFKKEISEASLKNTFLPY
jgi:hypothetical protein